MLDFVYDDFEPNDFVTEAPSSCDFVVEDFVNTDFAICIPTTEEPSRTGGIGGFSSSRPVVVGYRGRPLPPFDILYKDKEKPEHIIIEETPEKITDTLGKRIEELVITKPEPIPIYIDFIPVRKTIQTVPLVEKPQPKPKPESPKPDIEKLKREEKERLRKAALKKKLRELEILLHLTFIEHYV